MTAQPVHIPAEPGEDLSVFISIPAEALGRLRREIIWTMGEHRAQSMLARMGVSWGQADAFRGDERPPLMDNLGSVTRAATENPEDVVFESARSVEAREHLRFFRPDTGTPQCWLLAGYLTGLVSQATGRTVYFLETSCAAKHDPVCRFEGRSRDAWAAEDADLSFYDEENVNVELAGVREQLRLTKDRYQNLFEQSGAAIFIVDPDTGVCLNANLAAEELTGYPREDLVRMNLFDLCHPQEHHEIISDMKTLAAGARTADREVSIMRKDGLIRIIAQSSKMLTYGGQRVVQTIMRDVTDLKMSNQKEKDLQHQLMRSERLSSIGRLAAGVAHELKNPLGAIRNAIYYIRNALAPNPIMASDPHLKDIMKLAEAEIDAAVVIIGELLDFSRVVQIVPRRTSINEVLEKLPSIVLIPENIELVWDLDLTLPSAMVDPDRLNQVFCNLANNAVQAMPQGGKLTIRTHFIVEATGEEVTGRDMIGVEFEDTGVGIEALHLSKVFEPLFTTKARGTGLGLAISRNIVEKHGGVILVRSQVGKGTSFTVKLPVKPSEDGGGEMS
jgi:PAS domain S-box-containing protein